MALKLVTGGTEGAQDGTLVSSDGSYSNSVVVTAPYTVLHMRCDDGYWSDDQEFDLPAALPDGVTLEVSFNEGTDWDALSTGTPVAAPAIEDVNVPVWVRQTGEAEADELESGFRTDGTYDALPVLDDVTGFAAAVSGTTVELSWNAVSGAHHYRIEWGTDGVSYPNEIEDVSGTSYDHTGRSANSVYYYRIKAHGAGHTLPSANWDTCGAYVQRLFSAAHSRQVRAEHATFATARSGGGSNTAFTTDHTSHYAVSNLDTGVFYLDRAFMEWDTSAIPSAATVHEAWLRLTGLSNSGAGGIAICKGTYSNSPAVAGDFASVTLTDLGGPTGAPTVNTPTDYAIASPNTNLVKNGTSRLVLLERSKDYGNTAPSGYIAHEVGGLGNATADYRPRLKVSYGF